MKKKVLVTGGAGYIGSMLVSKLVQLGYKVTVIDLLKYSSTSLNHLCFNKNFKLIVDDVRNKNLIKKEIKKNEFIIPLAALVGAPLCKKNKKEAVSVNLDSIKFLMKNTRKKNKIIFLTSNSGYGIGKKDKFCDENSPLKPISLYGITKVEAEKIVMKSKNVLLAAAFSGLLLGVSAHADQMPKAETQEVMCYGVNSCKGQGSCAGKVDACDSKSGCETKITCAGHNECKGKGLVKMKKKDCEMKGGKVAS